MGRRSAGSSNTSRYVANYDNEIVAGKLEELGPFSYGDQASEQMIEESGLAVKEKEEVVMEMTKIKYTGEWAGTMRHGRGTQIWADGARYDGYFLHDKQEG
mmetsp:Transcript_25523/g.34112  ORF Transcript_25523/g.34112 Transcript_25523/m.34112 type:complete len:101 (-) Transcript_25523:654-956(-)